MREISRSDLFFRLCKRRILPIMSMVITPRPLLHKKQQSRLFTWLSFGSALPSKVAQFSVGANTHARRAGADCAGVSPDAAFCQRLGTALEGHVRRLARAHPPHDSRTVRHERDSDAHDLKALHAKIGQLTLENDFLEGALTKAGLLSARR
jgi:hypothetical protein